MASYKTFSKTLLFSALVLFLSALLVQADPSHVVALTDADFDKVIDGSKPALVEFYAPWCGHCKTLAPIYEELGTAYSHVKNDVIIAKVDADKHKALGGRFGVKGFPTLKWFPKGSPKSPVDYSSGRDLDSLVKFVDEKVGVRARVHKPQTFVEVLSAANFDEVVKNPKNNVLVEFYAPWCGHCKNLAPIYEKVAKDFATEPNVVVANLDATTSADIAERYGVTGYPTIKFFPAGGDAGAPEDYQAGRTEEAFVEFLNEKCGTSRAAGGGLNEQAGRVDALDKLAEKFASASAADRKTLIEEAQKAASQQSAKTAEYYVKVMKKIAGGNEGFPGSEIARLGRILDQGNAEPSRLDSMFIRKNILNSFVAGTTAADDAEDLDVDGRSEL
ncbi:thioredoxin-like protein [Powellomyces hirtus]|nr:thioredoxin-like protein [Powellomyces hirtus]